MTPKEFQQHLRRLESECELFFNDLGPRIAANTAVGLFKENFQTESFFGQKWQEVKRRQDTWVRSGKAVRNPIQGAGRIRKILTGATGDLGRSIEVKEASGGQAVIWSKPEAFGSKQPYGAVHNEGLPAGRGAGFRMPRRRFMGDHPQLRQAVAESLERKLREIFNK
jgi:phage gpG-like protein